MRLVFRYLEDHGTALGIHQRVDLARQAAARATHATGSAVFFLGRQSQLFEGVEIGVGIASEAGACGASLTSAVESVAQGLPSGVIDPAKVASGPGLGPRGDAGDKPHGTPQHRAG
jgi:hypothetical protein